MAHTTSSSTGPSATHSDDTHSNILSGFVANNKAFLVKNGIEHAIFEPTETGLKKAILDATQPVRALFELENFHFFSRQGQGQDAKVLAEAYFITHTDFFKSDVSLYRPVTKKGDPRMWFSNFKGFAKPNDQVAIIVFNNSLYLMNISQFDLTNEAKKADSPLSQFLQQYLAFKGHVAKELLQKLREIALKPIQSIIQGDTAIGMAVEHALGIPPNSDKKPDYKGIELKSGRNKKNRSNLFAQVAEWDLSPCKSSAEILDLYGYMRGGDKKLNCTSSCSTINSQGLTLYYDASSDQLIEKHENGDIVAVWTGSLLRARLLEKHSETFWIHAESTKIKGKEYFRLISVTHTRKPLVNQLLPLIQDGIITMDHLIKRKHGEKSAKERGPLFKIHPKNLHLLFPEPKIYKLQ